jgi:hypothetical protein
LVENFKEQEERPRWKEKCGGQEVGDKKRGRDQEDGRGKKEGTQQEEGTKKGKEGIKPEGGTKKGEGGKMEGKKEEAHLSKLTPTLSPGCFPRTPTK